MLVDEFCSACPLARQHAAFAQVDERAVPAQHLVTFAGEVPAQLGTLEKGRVLRIGEINARQVFKFLLAAFARGVRQLRGAGAGGKEKRGAPVVFFLPEEEKCGRMVMSV